MTIPLILPASIRDEIVRHAEAEWPAECCGLLAGRKEARGWVVATPYELANAAENRETEFLSEARSMFEAMRAIRRAGEEVLAVYHSHPSSEPMPSRKDVERRWADDVVTVIVGLASRPATVKGWWIASDGVRGATIRSEPDR